MKVIAPCLPTVSSAAALCPEWVVEIKHDRSGSLPGRTKAGSALQPAGNDLTHRFPLIVEVLAQLRARSCILHGEAVACAGRMISRPSIASGIAKHDADVFMWEFDLIEAQMARIWGAIRLRPLNRWILIVNPGAIQVRERLIKK